MRRFAVVVAMIGVALPSLAAGRPVRALSSRVVHYEQQVDAGAVAPERARRRRAGGRAARRFPSRAKTWRMAPRATE